MGGELDSDRVVLLDLDGTVAEPERRIADILLSRGRTLRPRQRRRMRHDYPARALLSDADRTTPSQEEIFEIVSAPGFYRDLPLMGGSEEGWRRIRNFGCRAVFCSVPLAANPECEAEKREWITRYFGTLAAEQALIVRDKTLCDGMALVDDSPAVTGARAPTWRHILYTQPYNLHVATDLRLRRLNDPALEHLLHRAARLSRCGHTV